MKKFLAILFGIILLIIYVALVIATFVVTTVSKVLIWITGKLQNILESLKVNISYEEN
jgi:hypothetical protein